MIKSASQIIGDKKSWVISLIISIILISISLNNPKTLDNRNSMFLIFSIPVIFAVSIIPKYRGFVLLGITAIILGYIFNCY